MRILNQRYNRDVARYNLATRMIGHEMRTHTIQQWTGLSPERIRDLYQSYLSEHGERQTVRHRGPSPQSIAGCLRSPRLRNEAAAFAGLCYALEIIPSEPVGNARRELPGVQRGERLCRAFELYRSAVASSRLTLEHAILLVFALAQGQELKISRCVHCGGAILVDPLGATRRACAHCRGEEISGATGRQTPPTYDVAPCEQQPLF